TTTDMKALEYNASEEVQRQHMRLQTQRDEQSSLNRMEHTVTQYDPITGVRLASTTQVSHQSQKSSSEQTSMEWQMEVSKRTAQLRILQSKTIQECKAISGSYTWFERQLADE